VTTPEPVVKPEPVVPPELPAAAAAAPTGPAVEAGPTASPAAAPTTAPAQQAEPAPVVQSVEPAPSAPSVESTPPDEGYVDLAALIFDEPAPATTRWKVAADSPSTDPDADFARILSQFKEQVSSHLEHDDARAHYELGSAYREMGLLSEAIAMFQEALHADPRFLAATEMLGRTFLDKGDLNAAIQVLNRGMETEVAVEDDLLGIYYYLGNAYEMTGNKAAAKDLYLKVFALDINFIDVTERLRPRASRAGSGERGSARSTIQKMATAPRIAA
jgi:tetratricopeptide (TPR) repeat protein